MQTTLGKFLMIACAAVVLSGYHLMAENRDTDDATLAAGPNTDHDANRALGHSTDAAPNISDGLAKAIADEAESRATKAILVAVSAKAAATPKPAPAPHKGIQPIQGSESIPFSNLSHSQLSDCSTLGVIELHHTGSLKDALIVLRNEAHRISNLLLPIKGSRTSSKEAGLDEISFEAQMMRCPTSLARGN